MLPQFYHVKTTFNSFASELAYLTNLCSSTYTDPDTSISTHYIAASNSNHVVKVYKYNNNGSLSLVHSLAGNSSKINDIAFSDSHPYILFSAAEDGTVVCWDVRTSTAKLIQRYKARQGAVYSVACSGNQLMVGGEKNIWYWDVRSPSKMMEITAAHTDAITQLYFHPSNSHMLLSGGEDCMVCQWDLSVDDMEDALDLVLSVNQPVSKMGFFGPSGRFLYSLSASETLSLWDLETTDMIADFSNIREVLTNKMKVGSANGAAGDATVHSSNGNDNMNTNTTTATTNNNNNNNNSATVNMSLKTYDGQDFTVPLTIQYLIDCHYDEASQRLFLCAGTTSGGLIINHVNSDDIQPFCTLGLCEEGSASTQTQASQGSSWTFSKQDGAIVNAVDDDVKGMGMGGLNGGSSRDVNSRRSHNNNSSNGNGIHNGDSRSDKFSNGNGNGNGSGGPANRLGHIGIIRSLLWSGRTILTAGQDSRICTWSMDKPSPTSSSASASSSSSSYSAAQSAHKQKKKQHKGQGKNRHSPHGGRGRQRGGGGRPY